MPSFTFCGPAAPGATCHPTFRLGRQCTTTSGVCAIPGIWHRLFTALREAFRERIGRNRQPSAAIMDTQTVKTVEESAEVCGYDVHKHIVAMIRLLTARLGRDA